MGRPTTSNEFSHVLARARYAVLKQAGADSRTAKTGATGGPAFATTLRALGGDPAKHPELTEERHGGNPYGWRVKRPRQANP